MKLNITFGLSVAFCLLAGSIVYGAWYKHSAGNDNTKEPSVVATASSTAASLARPLVVATKLPTPPALPPSSGSIPREHEKIKVTGVKLYYSRGRLEILASIINDKSVKGMAGHVRGYDEYGRELLRFDINADHPIESYGTLMLSMDMNQDLAYKTARYDKYMKYIFVGLAK